MRDAIEYVGLIDRETRRDVVPGGSPPPCPPSHPCCLQRSKLIAQLYAHDCHHHPPSSSDREAWQSFFSPSTFPGGFMLLPFWHNRRATMYH